MLTRQTFRLGPFVTLVAVLLCLLRPLWITGQPISPRGFLSKDVPVELALEQQAKAIPEPARLRSYMGLLASEPHNSGSARTQEIAQYLARTLREWGLDAYVEQFEALMPFPTIRLVEMVGPKGFVAGLKEPAIPKDPGTGDPREMPTYNAYGASGDVTAPVVYANFGVPDDYDWLDKQGISVRGKIVITRYGKSWRGIKPKVAAQHGAVACLIYSDPHEDGYFIGDVFPKGPMRPPEGVQRGSVLDMPLYPGDPLSPGWASEKGSKRLSISEAKTLMKIPVLPLSYADAQPILAQLTGPTVPAGWRGSLPITYHAGPGAALVHLKADYDWTIKPLYDVIATIPGTETPERWVMAGNHHDAWVNGADDPISGVASLLEVARTLAILQKRGWKPKRTIKIAFWDGEEFGLLGSTEWAEKHQGELREKAVAYLNSDNTGKGRLHVDGSHTLEAFAAEVGSGVAQPATNLNVVAASLPGSAGQDSDPSVAESAEKDFRIGALGAGSDYVAFLDFLGIASMNAEFDGRQNIGIYHSAYDSVYWYTHFSDSDFEDGKALAQYTSTALLRLADATVSPFEFCHFAATVSGYLDEIQHQAQGSGPLDLSGLRQQLEAIRQTGERYDALLGAAMRRDTLDSTRIKAVNQALLRSERVLTRPEGLPNRAWYKHQIYAPGFYTGYSVKTLPGIREAVDGGDWVLAQKQVQVLEGCLAQLNGALTDAIGNLVGL